MWIKFRGTVDCYGAPLGDALVRPETIFGIYEDILQTRDYKFACKVVTIEYGQDRVMYLPYAVLEEVIKFLNIQYEEKIWNNAK